MSKNKRTKTAAERTANADTLAMMLRGGGGKHGDRRTKRQRTRSAQRTAALSGW
ncbi:MAG: hypothetical protein ABIQ39_02070 [Ilumatobacteraceae bacterium]